MDSTPTIKKIQFKTSFLHHLRNEHYYHLLNLIVDTYKAEEINNEYFNSIAANATEYISECVELSYASLAHNNTVIINKLTSNRRRLISSLRKQIDGKKYTLEGEICQTAKVLIKWAKQFKKDLISRNVEKESQAIIRMEGVCAEDPVIKSSLEKLSLTELFNKIVDLTTRISNMDMIRDDENYAIKLNKKGRRQRSYESLRMMLDTINHMITIEGSDKEKIYNLGMNINAHIKNSHATYKFRKTMRDKKKDEEE